MEEWEGCTRVYSLAYFFTQALRAARPSLTLAQKHAREFTGLGEFSTKTVFLKKTVFDMIENSSFEIYERKKYEPRDCFVRIGFSA